MKRVVNFRPVFYCFLAFAIGIAFAYFVFSPDFLYIGIIATAIIVCLVFAIIRKKIKNFICIIFAFMFGIGAFFLDYNNFSNGDYGGQTCAVSGRVSEDIFQADNYVYVRLTNVLIDGNREKNLTISVSTYSSDFNVEMGDNVAFSAEIYNEFLFENGTFNSYVYRDNAPYFAYLESENITITSGNLSASETIRGYVKTLLYQFMPQQEAELSYSILFGDKSSLDGEVKESFSTSGIAHLLAVSGLHIGFLVAVLYWILKKFKCEGVPRFCIIAFVLLAYAYLCSFSPSVVRASIMCLAFLATKLFGRQYDLLNSLGIAGIIILLIKPLYVFDAGFQMSFVSVLAIAILFKSFSKFFNTKIKIPKRISDALAIDVATTLAIAPIFAIYFGKLSMFSWLANLICIPLFSVGYICLFVMIILVVMFNFLGFLLIIPELILRLIIWIAGLISSMEWAIVSLYTLSIVGTIIFYLTIFFASRFFMAKWCNKFVAIATTFVIGGALLLTFNSPLIPNSFSYTQLNSNSPCAVLTSTRGEVMVVGNGDLAYTEQYLKFKKYYKVTTLVLTEIESTICYEFIQKYDVEYVVNYTNSLVAYGDFGVQFLYLNNIKKAVYLEIDNIGIVFAVNRIGDLQAQILRETISTLNAKILFEKKQTFNFLNVADFEIVLSSAKIETDVENHALMVDGSFTFSVDNGIIGQIRSIN